MTSLAKDMGLTTVVSPETAPHLFVPSMIQASISTVPLVVNTDPFPALNTGMFSSSRTYFKSTHLRLSRSKRKRKQKIGGFVQKLKITTCSTTSKGGLLALRASTPIWRQWRRAASRGWRRSGGRERGMSPAPPWSAIAHPISFFLSVSALSLTPRECDSIQLTKVTSVGWGALW